MFYNMEKKIYFHIYLLRLHLLPGKHNAFGKNEPQSLEEDSAWSQVITSHHFRPDFQRNVASCRQIAQIWGGLMAASAVSSPLPDMYLCSQIFWRRLWWSKMPEGADANETTTIEGRGECNKENTQWSQRRVYGGDGIVREGLFSACKITAELRKKKLGGKYWVFSPTKCWVKATKSPGAIWIVV